MIPYPVNLPESLKESWDRLAPVLEEMGTLREVDAEALARYLLLCNEYAHITAATVSAIKGNDVDTVKDWLTMQAKLSQQLAEYEDRFGLTAESRKKNGWIVPKKMQNA